MVEDETLLADTIAAGLRRHAMAVDVAYDGSAALDRATVNDYDVVVLDRELVDPMGWRAEDLTYLQAESQAALLAWLWSLPCMVVNRYEPAIWYRPNAPLLAWHGLLTRAGLPTLDTEITNANLSADLPAVFAPLTTETRYLVARDDEWRGVAALQEVTPARRDEALRFADRLAGAGNSVEVHLVPGVPHMFDTLAPALRASRRAVAAWTQAFADGIGIGIGLVGFAALSGIARQPEQAGPTFPGPRPPP